MAATKAREEPLAVAQSPAEVLDLSVEKRLADSIPEINLPGSMHRIVGRVLDRASGSALEGYSVELYSPTEQFGDTEESTTNTEGLFEMLLPSDRFEVGNYYPMRVGDATENVAFFAAVALEKDMTILVDPLVMLHGTVMPVAAVPFPWEVAIAVNAYEPITGSNAFVTSQVNEQGRFIIPARLRDSEASVLIRFVSEELRVTVPADLPDLVSAGGAVVRVDVREVRVHVFDEQRSPLPSAEVTLWRPSSGDVIRSQSNATGSCLFRVPTGAWRWSVTKPGCYPGTGIVDVGEETTELQCKLTAAKRHQVRGEVVSGLTKHPIAGAAVSAWEGGFLDQYTGTVDFTPYIDKTVTDDKGHFELDVPPDAPICLLIAARDHAESPGVQVEAGAPWVRIVMGGAGEVIVRPRAIIPIPGSTGRTRCLLVDRERHRVVSRTGYPPFAIGKVPVGSYNVYVAAPDGSYGQAAVEVTAGQRSEVVVDSVPSTWFDGQLSDRAGRPVKHATVRFTPEPEIWPEEVSRVFGQAKTDSRGHYRVCGGLALWGRIEFHDEHGEVSQHDVQADRAQRLIIK